ncbi:MAG TPA: N-acetylmuramoyl-L-alanine amidase [Chthoniobacterales bacterium]|nr:N-acetylmuramoyl-L-alanine amidase [Chthoniobacterales bacterium]
MSLKVILSGVLLLTFVSLAAAEDWKVIKAEGRDYVTFANVARFYQFPKYTHVNRTVSLRDERRGLRAQGGTSEFYINGVRFFSDYPLLARADANLISATDVAKIIEPVLRPHKITAAKKIDTVVLDPGHGGEDSGTAGRWGSEKIYTLDVALAARQNLLQAGFKVQMTRDTDKTVSLEERVAFANQFPNAVFISIHFNSARGGSGVESYALAPAGVPSNAASEDHASSVETHWYAGNAQDTANIALSAAVHGSILSRVSVFDRGVRHARFHVLRDIRIPGMLVEAGFLNDRIDGPRVATRQYRARLGQAIAEAVTNFNKAVNFQTSETTLVTSASNLPPHTHSILESLGRSGRAPVAPEQEPSAVIQGSP